MRPATLADLPFIDALQKRHAKQVGWMPRQQLEGKVRQGQVLVAEENPELGLAARGSGRPAGHNPEFRIGYCIASDRYFKRDDVGIVYQMNVVPEAQRSLVGAALLKAVFERAAYGCRLFCCWCAQDIGANRFWEAMGFVPLAYRAGSEAKGRVHIFWQRRVRAGDVTTPWWFPAKTDAGAMREDRLVLPIPPGRGWSDEMPLLRATAPALEDQSDGGATKAGRTARRKPVPAAKGWPPAPAPPRARVQFGPPSARPAVETDQPPHPTPETPEKPAKRSAPPRERKKADPKLVAAARELRDRWLERVNGERLAAGVLGKYDVSRLMDGPDMPAEQPMLVTKRVARPRPALPAPAAA